MFGGVLMITFIGFMEMCSVTKGIAAKTKQKINMDQEMIGQGLAGIASSLSGSYPPSGSFSRSALNYEAGAKTGMSSVFTGIIVLLTLLFFTKFLYYLPKSALAAIIFAAVFGLINIRKMVENWKISWEDGLTGTLTFAATLLFAPDLVKGILIGVFSSIFLYLYRTMKPRVAVLGLHSDGTYRDADLHNLSIDEEMPIIRFDGRLYFANVSYFEDTMLAVLSRFPNAKAVAVACDGINDIDASGVEVIEDLVKSLGKVKLPLYFVGIKQHVYERMERSGLIDLIGKDNIFRKIEEVRSISRNS
jgi:SulP family sulfate permease